jgi:hypothetical protein
MRGGEGTTPTTSTAAMPGASGPKTTGLSVENLNKDFADAAAASNPSSGGARRKRSGTKKRRRRSSKKWWFF